jgi:hypothetical protein
MGHGPRHTELRERPKGTGMPPMSFKGFADHNTEAAETADTAQLYKLDGLIDRELEAIS